MSTVLLNRKEGGLGSMKDCEKMREKGEKREKRKKKKKRRKESDKGPLYDNPWIQASA